MDFTSTPHFFLCRTLYFLLYDTYISGMLG
jgi:hypothetical protein